MLLSLEGLALGGFINVVGSFPSHLLSEPAQFTSHFLSILLRRLKRFGSLDFGFLSVFSSIVAVKAKRIESCTMTMCWYCFGLAEIMLSIDIVRYHCANDIVLVVAVILFFGLLLGDTFVL